MDSLKKSVCLWERRQTHTPPAAVPLVLARTRVVKEIENLDIHWYLVSIHYYVILFIISMFILGQRHFAIVTTF